MVGHKNVALDKTLKEGRAVGTTAAHGYFIYRGNLNKNTVLRGPTGADRCPLSISLCF